MNILGQIKVLGKGLYGLRLPEQDPATSKAEGTSTTVSTSLSAIVHLGYASSVFYDAQRVSKQGVLLNVIELLRGAPIDESISGRAVKAKNVVETLIALDNGNIVIARDGFGNPDQIGIVSCRMVTGKVHEGCEHKDFNITIGEKLPKSLGIEDDASVIAVYRVVKQKEALSRVIESPHDSVGEVRSGMLLNPGISFTKSELCSSPDNVLYVKSNTQKMYKLTPLSDGRVEVICALERSLGREGKYILETDSFHIGYEGDRLKLKVDATKDSIIETSPLYAMGILRDGVKNTEFEQMERSFNVAADPSTE